MKKNDIVKLEITGITSEGNGVGRADNGIAVFVPFTAVGDIINTRIVKVNKNFCYGIIEDIINPSDKRCESDCEVFSKCGGCSFRHMSYESELRAKQLFVSDAFRRIGGLSVDFEEIVGCDKIDFYRNKAQYPVAVQDGKAVCGFYSKRSHRVVPFTACRLQPEIFREIADFITSSINKNNIPAYDEKTGKGILRHIYIRQGYHTSEIMLCLVVNTHKTGILKKIAESAAEKFPDIKTVLANINTQNTNVIMGDKTDILYGDGTITDIMCGNKIILSEHSFYQINTPQAERLYGIAKEYANLSGNECILDLYCGAGTIGLSMADKISCLYGVEIVPQAIENAKQNAILNNIQNAEFICGDAGKTALKLAESGKKPDVIFLDPARKGCDDITLKSVNDMSPEKIVMISCNPATCARDVRILSDMGYRIEKARAVDMFPRTVHVECVVLLTKKEK